MKKYLMTAAFAAVMAFPAQPSRAEETVTTTTQTVKSVSVPGATTVMGGGSGASTTTVTTDGGTNVTVVPADETGVSMSSTGMLDTHSVTTTTDTVTTTATAPGAVVAPSVPGHKKGDHKDMHEHAATGSDEANTAGDKAANAVTPLKESATSGKTKIESNGDITVTH